MKNLYLFRLASAAAVTLTLTVAAFSLGRASSATFDATFWRGLDNDARLRFVQGVTDGASIGYADGYIDGVKAAFDAANDDVNIIERTSDVIPMNELAAATRKRLGVQEGRILQTLLSLKTTPPNFPNSFGTYIDAVTHYYDTSPSKAGDSPAAIMMKPAGK